MCALVCFCHGTYVAFDKCEFCFLIYIQSYMHIYFLVQIISETALFGSPHVYLILIYNVNLLSTWITKVRGQRNWDIRVYYTVQWNNFPGILVFKCLIL